MNARSPLVALIILALLGLCPWPRYREHRRQRDLQQCLDNLRNIDTALKMDSTGNAGHYPPSLRHLGPEHLKSQPDGPALVERRFDKQ